MTKRIGIYGPYFGVMGGGELYLGTMAEILSHDHQVDLISESEISLPQFQKFFGLDLSRVHVRNIPAIPFVESLNPFFHSRKREYSNNTAFTQEYDLFILMPRNFRIPFQTHSKNSILHLQVPDRPWKSGEYLQELFRGRWVDVRNEMIKALKYPQRYSQFNAVLINSEFHKRIISNRLKNPNAMVLHPPVTLRTPRPWSEKEDSILAVGRFFRGLHSKNQDILLDAFRSFTTQLPGWKLMLAGGLSEEPYAQEYFDSLRNRAKGLAVEFFPNINSTQLDELYSRSRFFWHAAGFKAKESEPEKMEHFGISTVEAMSAGGIPIVYRAGGQLEIIQAGINGAFWTSEAELVNQTIDFVRNETRSKEISSAAIERSREFGKDRFEQRLLELIKSIL